MANVNNLLNKISDGIGRSSSSARFQIAKVFDDESNPKTILGKATSIPISM
jgi:hypothetical protein